MSYCSLASKVCKLLYSTSAILNNLFISYLEQPVYQNTKCYIASQIFSLCLTNIA